VKCEFSISDKGLREMVVERCDCPGRVTVEKLELASFNTPRANAAFRWIF
jgi:hypothetical protein